MNAERFFGGRTTAPLNETVATSTLTNDRLEDGRTATCTAAPCRTPELWISKHHRLLEMTPRCCRRASQLTATIARA